MVSDTDNASNKRFIVRDAKKLSESAQAAIDKLSADMLARGRIVWPKRIWEQAADGKWFGRSITLWDIRKRALVTQLLCCEPEKKSYWRNLLHGHLLIKTYRG